MNPEHLKTLKQGMEVWNRWREENPDVRPDLFSADLGGANLGGANLSAADLRTADLIGADLRRANLDGANLGRAKLSGANLSGADLRRANLDGANLGRAKLSGANLSRAYLSRANLLEADLSTADLGGADLSGAGLGGANLREAHLIGADLREANLGRANLSGADLRDTDLSEVDIEGTDLRGAKMSGSQLTLAQLASARVDVQTMIRSGLLVTSQVVDDANAESVDRIVRQIEFPPQHHQAGLSILEYFGTVVRQKYPHIPVKVRIEQEGLKVRMVVETPEGKKEPIEETLTEYGLVVVGRKKPEDLLADKFHILQLEQTLQLERVRHEQTLRILEIKQEDLQESRRKYDQLLSLVGDKLLQRQEPVSVVVVVEGFFQLRDSLKSSERLSRDQRDEALDLLRTLTEQLDRSEDERLDKATLDRMLQRVSQLAGMAGAAASIFNVWGPQIAAALGVVLK